MSVFLFLLSFFPNAMAQSSGAVARMKTRTLGVGVAVGAPTGLTSKLYLGSGKQNLAKPNLALQFSLGGALGHTGDLSTNLDFIYQGNALNKPDEYLFTSYFGFGVTAGAQTLEKTFAVGPRLVGGMAAIIPNNPVEIYVEVAPAFILVSTTSWSFDGQLGMRYFF